MLKFIAVAAILFATPAFAAPDEPVKAIMDLATQLWSDKPPEGKDYFDKDHIALFSKDSSRPIARRRNTRSTTRAAGRSAMT